MSAFAIATIRAVPALNSLFSNYVRIKIGVPTFKLFLFENNKIDNFLKTKNLNSTKNNRIIPFKKNLELKILPSSIQIVISN